MSNIYAQDGVDVELGDLASKHAAKCCEATYGFSNVAEVTDMSFGNFRGPRGVLLNNEYQNCILSCAPDGIGTKVVLIDMAQSWKTAARDIMAMTSFDLVRWGGKPVYFTSVLDVSSLGNNINSKTFQAVTDLYDGMVPAAKEIGIIVLNGETAELSNTVSSDNPDAILKFNWGGSVHGIFHKDKMITGEGLKAGQVIIAMNEYGFRSNGISSVRAAFSKQFGKYWFENSTAQKFIKYAAEPSILYDNFFSYLNGWGKDQNNVIKIHSIIHLTGGSFESKLGKDVLFPKGLSAVLDNPCKVPYIMRECADWRGMTTKDIYDTWNAGQGALAIIDEFSVENFMKIASLMKLDCQVAGYITEDDTPNIRIVPSLKKSEDIIYTT
jgi:phosphoribosylformylglycinamidine cyclo-ligase